MGVFTIRTVRDVPKAQPSVVSMGGPGQDGASRGSADVVEAEQGVFVTPQTLSTFAGATLAVSLIWKAAGVVRPGLEKEAGVGLLASIVVGIVLYLISESSSGRGRLTRNERLVSAFVAFVNTLILFSAAMGARGTTA